MTQETIRLHQRIKHAMGLRYQAEGNFKEARICFAIAKSGGQS